MMSKNKQNSKASLDWVSEKCEIDPKESTSM